MKRAEYPLCWPPNWPRTESHKRTGSQLKTTLAGAIENVNDELRRFGKDSGKQVSEILISSNVTLTTPTPKDPGVAVYFTWDGISTCLAVDRFLKLQDNLQAIARVLEAERTKMRYGGLNLVRASFAGYMALPGPKDRKAWHEVLGVAPNANGSTIAEAYRRRRSDTHPDRGGTSEQFNAVQAAYEEARNKGLVS